MNQRSIIIGNKAISLKLIIQVYHKIIIEDFIIYTISFLRLMALTQQKFVFLGAIVLLHENSKLFLEIKT